MGGGDGQRNVRLALLFTAANSVAYGIWGYTVLSAFLEMQPGGGIKGVGYAEGMQGTLQAFAAVPAGLVADRYSRESALRASAALGFVANVVLLIALLVGRDHDWQFAITCVGLSLFGAFQGACQAPLEALFHDSVTAANRSKAATRKYMVSVACNGAGPLMSLIFFLIFGNRWTFDSLTNVMCIGVCLSFVPAVLICLPRDSDALGTESEPIQQRYESPRVDIRADARAVARDMDAYYLALRQGGSAAVEDEYQDEEAANRRRAASDGGSADGQSMPAPYDHSSGGNGNTVPLLATSAAAVDPDQLVPTSKRRFKEHIWVPRLVIICDMTSGFASGMTIRFFPLFFKNKTGLSPAAVSTIFVISPLLMVFFARIAYRLSKRIGRVKVPILFNSLGILLLFIMYWMGEWDDEACWKDWRIIVPIYLLRTAFQNCSRPLRKSLLMDYVPKENRGVVSSFESVSALGWSGSAALGGQILSAYGYGASFVVTAALQALALGVYSTILLLPGVI